MTEPEADAPSPVHRRERRRINGIVFIAAAVLACAADQLSKLAVRTFMTVGQGIHVIPGFELRSVRNQGIAFSLFSGHAEWIVGGTVLVAVLLFTFLSQLTRDRIVGELAVGVVAGGALGNLIDRVRLGYVVDFLHVSHFAVFNVADCCITVGVIAVLAVQLLLPDDKPE